MKFGALTICTFVLMCLPTAGIAQPAITDVFNAANRIQRALPGHGIAQGSLFAIKGAGLGPTDLLKANFPLPSTDGLGGVTVTVQSGGTTTNAILVFVSDKEVAAILPSSTPLGDGNLTLNNNGVTLTAPILVVASAFGSFSSDYYSGLQQTISYNVTGDGSTVANSIPTPAMPGQTVRLIGTGLGAIMSDETSPGATDVPTTPEIKVFIGTKQAKLNSAGRGNCCDPWPDSFPIPRGIAAIDVLEFVLPDGITGCHASVAVQVGNVVSNIAQIAISPDGNACIDLNAVDFGDTVTVSGTAKFGIISLLQTFIRSSAAQGNAEIGTEVGVAEFIKFDAGPVPVALPVSVFGILANNLNPGSCVQGLYRVERPTGTTPPPPDNTDKTVFLDAGDPITLKNGDATKLLRKGKDLVYSGSLGSSFNLPGLPASNSLFLTPGTITADNGGGGPDVPAFNVSLTLPKPAIKFENAEKLEGINRADGVTVTWSGGDPNGFVTILGTSAGADGTAILNSTFGCTERNSAGTFTVPSFVLLGLPPTSNVGNLPANGLGTIGIQSYVAQRVNIPTMDLAMFADIVLSAKSVVYK